MPLERTPTLTVNGISGVTGKYAVEPLSTADLAGRLRRSRDSAGISALRTDRGRRLKTRAFPALPLGVRPEDVATSGWTVVFHRDEDVAVRAALEPLIAHRLQTMVKPVQPLTYYPDDSVEGWLGNLGVGWGNITPEKVPYYLLLVGAPSRIPYQFAQTLDAEYCVGLLDLPDAAAYQRYVKSVIEYEKSAGIANKKEIVYFGTRHPFDDATILSADWLMNPLTDGLPARPPSDAVKPVADEWSFAQRKFVGDTAKRETLLDVLAPADQRPPALFFSATHGMVFPNGHERQFPAQGALLCQDWSGFGDIAASHYLAAADVPDTASVAGVIAFLFACFGGGTPLEDRFVHEAGAAPPAIAPKPFAAALPSRLLTHPGGGTLACIAHVERAWGYSISGQTMEPQIGPFRRAIGRLMLGQPVGLAVQEFNDKCATASVSLANLLEKAYAGRPVDDVQLATTWTERNDAEGYVTLGDPAVHLRLELLKA
jgi:hypothetical protein